MSDEASKASTNAGSSKPGPIQPKRYFVTGSPGGGWAIFREGEPKPLAQVPRKINALETARTMARYNLPSEVIVEQEDGSYQIQYEFPLGTPV